MRTRIYNNLGFRLIVTTIIIIAVVVAGYSAFTVQRGRQQALNEIRTKGNLLAAHLAFNSRMAVFAENTGLLKETASAVVAEPDVVLVGIYSAELKQLYFTDKRAGVNAAESAAGFSHVLMGNAEKDRQPGGPDMLTFVKPVVLRQYRDPAKTMYFGEQSGEEPERTIGYVHVVLSPESLVRQQHAILVTNALLALLFIAASSVVVYVWVKKAVKPLETLTEQVKAMGKGGPVEQVHVKTDDEIGRLSTAFNVMLQERQKAEQALEKVLMDIHDGIGGITTNISLLSQVARQAASREDTERSLKTISELARDGMVEVRSLMYSLDRNDLNWHTLAAELRNQGAKYLDPHRIEFSMTSEIDTAAPNPSSYLCLNLFRIFREALMNVIKHARAGNVTVSFRVSRERLALNVQDDGKGYIPVVNSPGRGIHNMMIRSREMSGTCTLRGDAGTIVAVEIPFTEKTLHH